MTVESRRVTSTSRSLTPSTHTAPTSRPTTTTTTTNSSSSTRRAAAAADDDDDATRRSSHADVTTSTMLAVRSEISTSVAVVVQGVAESSALQQLAGFCT